MRAVRLLGRIAQCDNSRNSFGIGQRKYLGQLVAVNDHIAQIRAQAAGAGQQRIADGLPIITQPMPISCAARQNV